MSDFKMVRKPHHSDQRICAASLQHHRAECRTGRRCRRRLAPVAKARRSLNVSSNVNWSVSSMHGQAAISARVR